MTVINIESRLSNIQRYRFNPIALQRDNLLILRQGITGSADIVDPTNPVVNLLETFAVGVAGFMQQDEVLTRKTYPIAAVTEDELYLHMTDKDYLNCFALPSKIEIVLLMLKSELTAAMKPDGTTGMKKVTFPRNTFFTVADTVFSLQYPVDVRMQAHGGIDAIYDESGQAGLEELLTNQVVVDERKDPSGLEFIQITLPVTQFSITTKYNDLNAATGFSTRIALTDKFYYARVYIEQSDGSWRELNTTHTDQNYDIYKPTAALRVYEDHLIVKVPTVYTSQGLKGKLRIDVYQTKGDIQLSLKNYAASDYVVRFHAIDSKDKTPFVAALSNLRTVVMYSESEATGGRRALTFEEKRERVINHTVGPQVIPITNVSLENQLQDKGYEIVRNVDSLTNRIFQAVKPLPAPKDDRLITSAGASINTVTVSFSELPSMHGVLLHSSGATITPQSLYRNQNGITKLVSKADWLVLNSLSLSEKVTALKESFYYYSPFHYVLDNTSERFISRADYLDGPKVVSKNFQAQNPPTGIQVSTASTYLLERIDQGYRLTVSTASNDNYKALVDESCYAQLSFKSKDGSVAAFMLGSQKPRASQDDERVFVFDMLTDFAIDSSHSIDQKSFLFSPTTLTTRCALEQEFQIYFITDSSFDQGVKGSIIDQQLGHFQLPTGCIGLGWDKLRLRFGLSLDTLWTQTRTTVNELAYRKHTEDIPAYYDADVFEVDANGACFDVVNDEIVYRYLHRKGDPKLTPDGEPMYAARAGENVLDLFGKPIPVNAGDDGFTHFVDIFSLEAEYRLATDSVSKDYRELIARTLVSWIDGDLASIEDKLLDESRIYFYPKVTQGSVRAMVLNSQEVFLQAGQSLTVTLTMPQETFQNEKLLSNLKKTTIRTLDACIKQQVYTATETQKLLMSQYGQDIISVQVAGVGGQANYPVVTVLDDQARMGIRKRLSVQPDDRLIVEDDVTFIDVVHSVDNL